MKAFITLTLVCAVYGQFGKLGGWHTVKQIPQDVTNWAKTYVQNSMNGMDVKSLEISQSNMQAQVVAGMNYRFTVVVSSHHHTTTECMFEVYHALDDTITNRAGSPKCSQVRRQLIGKPLAGGVNAVDVNDKGLQGAVQSASKSVNMMSNAMMHMTVVHVSNPTQQVVRGMKYTFDVDFQEAATCKNTADHFMATLAECPIADGGMKTSFHCVVFDVAWETPRYTTKCTMH